MFPVSTRAASAVGIICQPNTTCTIGEFLYDDSYNSLTTASCSVKSYNPDGSVFINNVSASAASNGYYSYTFTAPSTNGIYPTQLCCTVSGSLMCLDKSFQVQSQTSQSSLSQGDVANAVWNANRSSFTASGSFGQALQNVVPAAGDIASATWGYSTRTLTSFGTLISDIWNSSQNAGTNQDQIIKNDIVQSRDMLDKILDKPIIETSLQDNTPNVQSKLNETKTHIDQLIADRQYISSKIAFIKRQFDSLKKDDIVTRLEEVFQLTGEESDSSQNTLFAHVQFLRESWDWEEIPALYIQTKDISVKLSQVKKDLIPGADTSQGELSGLIASLDKEALLENRLMRKMKQVLALASTLEGKSSEIESLLSAWDRQKNIIQKVKMLSEEIEGMNGITKSAYLFPLISQASDARTIKNTVLDLHGIIDANKKLLAKKPGEAFSSTWLGEGSIIFNTLVTNPSQSISQTVPVKVYLPAEVKKENIMKISDGLSVSYDPEKDQYYYSGNVPLLPGETKRLKVEVNDSVFTISQEEITGMRKQAEDFFKAFGNTSSFAQAAALKRDIDGSLDKIAGLGENAITPDEKIRTYREAQLQLSDVRGTIDELKKMIPASRPAGLFNFTGNIKTGTVWGFIAIIAAAFVFFALYIRKHYLHLSPLFKFTMALFVFGTFGGIGLGIFIGTHAHAWSKNIAQQVKPTNKTGYNLVPGKDVLAYKTHPADKTFQLFVPLGGQVNVYKSPSLDSFIVTSITTTQAVVKGEDHDKWVKITVVGQKPPNQGWVDKDFVTIDAF